MPGPRIPGLQKARLCHFFDNRGHRIYLHGEFGCPRSSGTCNFVHPSDPEWESLARRETRRFSDDHSARRSPPTSPRGRDRRRSPSFDRQPPTSPRRPRTSPRESVRVRSPVRHHESSPSPRHNDRDIRFAPRRSSSSHDHPSLIERLDLNRKPNHAPPSSKPPPGPLMSLDHDLKSSPVTGTAATTPAGITTSAPSKPSSEIVSKPSGSVAVPSRRPFPDVLPPPPLQNSSLPGDDTMTPEQRRAVWEKRIALMADATKEFMELEKLEQDMLLRRRQVQTSSFAALPSDIRTSFQTGLASAESAYEKKKDSYNSMMNRLSETNFWPTVPSQRVGELETKLKEAKTMLGGLADGVGQLYKKIEGLYEQRLGGPSAKRPKDVTAAGSGDGAVHTRKRRRLSVNESDESTPSDIREDVVSIKNTIREIEDHLHDVENDITQHSCHIMEQLEGKIEEKIEDIARNTDISSLVEVRLGPQTVKTIQAFSESFAHADREIGELALEVADLIPKLDSLKRDNDHFKQEEAASKELLAELTKADQENAQALARLQNEAKLLESAFKAHATRAIRPSLPPLPTSRPFIDAIEGTIQKQVHEQILPLFAEARMNTERIAQARDLELYENLISYKSDQTSKLPQLISTWLERHPEYLQALTAAAASGKSSSGGSSRVST